MDENAHEVTRAGQVIPLTATEFNLLRFFLLNPRHVLSKSQILDHVWHYDFGGDGNVVETYVSYLRKKLEVAGPPVIHTVRLVGYALREPAPGLTVSLRARLLIAIGIIAVVALGHRRHRHVLALESFLYQRVDQQLAGARGLYEHAIEQGRPVSVRRPRWTVRLRAGAGARRPADGDARRRRPVQRLPEPGRPGPHRVRARPPALDCPAYVDNVAYTPVHPLDRSTGSRRPTTAARSPTFDAPSAQAGRPGLPGAGLDPRPTATS